VKRMENEYFTDYSSIRTKHLNRNVLFNAI
jgi:hypothetical protein